MLCSHENTGAAHDLSGVNPANQLLGDDGFPTELGYLYIGARDNSLLSNAEPLRSFLYPLLACIFVFYFTLWL